MRMLNRSDNSKSFNRMGEKDGHEQNRDDTEKSRQRLLPKAFCDVITLFGVRDEGTEGSVRILSSKGK